MKNDRCSVMRWNIHSLFIILPTPSNIDEMRYIHPKTSRIFRRKTQDTQMKWTGSIDRTADTISSKKWGIAGWTLGFLQLPTRQHYFWSVIKVWASKKKVFTEEYICKIYGRVTSHLFKKLIFSIKIGVQKTLNHTFLP